MESWKAAMLCSLPLCLPMAVQAHSDEQSRVDKLEQEVALLKAQQQGVDWTDRVKLNGFATFGVGKANNDAGYHGYDEDVAFDQDSLMALQATFTVTDKTQAVFQLIGRGNDDWDPEFEWAYLSTELSDSVTLRGGKLRLPLYMLSDYLEVGYAYNFARPSSEVYELVPINAYDGMDMLIKVELGDAVLTIQPFYGHSSTAAFSFDDLLGIGNLLEWEEFSFRFSYAEAELDGGGVIYDGEFLGVGFQYDNGMWNVMAEYIETEADSVVPDYESSYISVGYRFGRWTPYVMYSTGETTDDDERAGIPAAFNTNDFSRTTWSFGIRYDVAQGMAIKLDYSMADDFEGTTGYLPGNELAGDPLNSNLGLFDDANVYSLLVDVVF